MTMTTTTPMVARNLRDGAVVRAGSPSVVDGGGITL
jgi:hypothetical protein